MHTRLLKCPLKRGRWRGEEDVNVGLSERCYDDRQWLDLDQYRVQWAAVLIATLILRGLLPQY